MKDFLKELNEEQRSAVLNTEGPTLVVAGAGSGKTKVLTSRLVHIVNEKKAWPNQILCVTFTNKAAKEILSSKLHKQVPIRAKTLSGLMKKAK